MAPQQLISEFHVRQLPDGRWQAVARYEITPRMAALGARSVISADTLADLDVLCAIERDYVARIRRAESSAQVIELEPGHKVAS